METGGDNLGGNVHCARTTWHVAPDVWVGVALSHGMDHSGDIYGGGTQRHGWVRPAPPVPSSVPVLPSYIRRWPSQPQACPPGAQGPTERGENSHHTGTAERTKAGMAEAQVTDGAWVRPQAQADTPGKCS